MNKIKVIGFDARYVKDFADLNKEWIGKYFVLEPMDTYQLDNAEETIIAKGGEIFFVLDGEKALGTCAMVPMENNGYELAKMAVAPETRGRGFGDLLMTHSITWAKEKKADYVLLHSNTVLEPAITLYKKHGFETVYLGPHPDYERSNIEMRLNLK
jgi:ribosomal protein S18 acetylase RimI-like enzyme